MTWRGLVRDGLIALLAGTAYAAVPALFAHEFNIGLVFAAAVFALFMPNTAPMRVWLLRRPAIAQMAVGVALLVFVILFILR